MLFSKLEESVEMDNIKTLYIGGCCAYALMVLGVGCAVFTFSWHIFDIGYKCLITRRQ